MVEHDLSDAGDPILRSSLREALVALAAWAVLGVVTLSVAFGLGYGLAADEVPTTLGVPSWAFWGVIVPWIAANIFTWWFAFRFIEDGDLGGDGEGDAEPETRGDDARGADPT